MTKRVLVTGGSRGIGRAVADALTAAGASVWIASRSIAVPAPASRSEATELRATRNDISDEKDVERLFSEIRRDWGGVDGVVHAAAMLGSPGSFWSVPASEFQDVLRANLLGSFLVAKHFVRSWSVREPTPAGRGKIVLFAGGGAGYGYPKFLPYGTSKAAVVRMTETMALEIESEQIAIDINCIAPGANETDMLRAVRAAGAEVRTVVPFSKPIELVAWLLSPASDGISGRFIHVNDPYQTMLPQSLTDDAFKLRRKQP
jgi:3-oxoacyl-[acyl-carrier protein] reductase